LEKDITIAGVRIPPETKTSVSLKVCRQRNGSVLEIPVNIITGREIEPRLFLSFGLHGSEWSQLEYLEEIISRIDPNELKGTIMGIPVANPMAFSYHYTTRNTPDESDEPDLNRAFPGKPNLWITGQIAHTITTHILSKTDYLMDFHNGPWGAAALGTTYGIDFPDKTVVEKSFDISKNFGCGFISPRPVVTNFPGPKSLAGYAGAELKIPNALFEIGGVGFGAKIESKWKGIAVQGIMNVMKHLGMIDGKPELPKRQLVFEKAFSVRPSVGGYLKSYVDPETLGNTVNKGTLLGEVISPYTFKTLEKLEAPTDGILFFTARSYPVDPGDWAFALIDLETSHWI
jgi:predicted deacylase